ncbi:MAG: hypothetical protein RBS13_01365 [Bacteroidales bacterium]|jgi:hypothetical protein|nr:hypothetical protein [Bacteroidales bacterium]
MKKISVTLGILIAVLSLSMAQPAFFPHNQEIKNWYIAPKANELREEIQKVIVFTEVQSLLSEKNVKADVLYPNFQFIDFDKDGLKDLLFEGIVGNKSHVFIFKKKTKDHYLLVLNQAGEILQANAPYENNALSLTIWNQSCCNNKVSTLTKWVCFINNNVSYFKVQEQSLVYKNTLLPEVGTKKIPLQHFTIKTEVAKLRISPRWDDESLIEGVNAWRGNHVSYHPQGASGVIYHSLKDKDGVMWYFIRINTGLDFPTKTDRFKVSKEIEDCENYSYYGWIHSENLNIITD